MYSQCEVIAVWLYIKVEVFRWFDVFVKSKQINKPTACVCTGRQFKSDTDWKSDILFLSETWLRPSSTVDTHLVPYTGKLHSFNFRRDSGLRTQSRTSTPSS